MVSVSVPASFAVVFVFPVCVVGISFVVFVVVVVFEGQQEQKRGVM